MTKTALVLVDIQNDYFEGGTWTLPHMDASAVQAARVLAHARTEGLDIVHIQHQAAPGAPFLVAGTHGGEINAAVTPLDGEPVITKDRPNSFHNTRLDAHLRDLGVTDIRLIGAMSQMCIDATARAGRDLGYGIEVIEDACAAKPIDFGGQTLSADQVHRAFMGALVGAYATVRTVDNIGA
mmetsp:Transcript_4795/g.7616  ORF Transcript_4795/g.7616 Transcript_4795/m.7616 type:complete len:181 (+) Transcript_4795:52-594(+)